MCEIACDEIDNDISTSDNLLLFLRDPLLRKVISIKISLHGSYLNKYRHKVHKNCLLISFTFIHWRFSLPFLLEAEKISGKNQLTFSIKRHHKDIYFRHICRKNLILISTKTFITVCFNLILMCHLINVILNCLQDTYVILCNDGIILRKKNPPKKSDRDSNYMYISHRARFSRANKLHTILSLENFVSGKTLLHSNISPEKRVSSVEHFGYQL